MKHYRPLLLQELDVRLPGVRVRRLRLNRHLPEVDQLARHSHAFSQILCYLSGSGWITVGTIEQEIGPGVVSFLPPHREHAFRETTGRRPLCLVLDLDWRGATKHGPSQTRLSQSEASAIRHNLAGMTRLSDPTSPSNRLFVAGTVLHLLDTLLRGLTLLPPRQHETPAIVRHFERELLKSPGPLPVLRDVAARMGYQTDYLNRIFKRATGRTLREHRDALLLEKARRLLRENLRVNAVCDRLGFPDQNYFARWFRKHTGLSPSAYASSSTPHPVPPARHSKISAQIL